MHISDLNNAQQITPMIIPAREVPHMVIEPTMKCNIECRVCYNHSRDFEKSLPEIRREIDLARKKRNLDSISLLGGEPTLHPDIVDIIKYIKLCKLHCQILTNGVIFLNDKEDRLLDQIVAAGIDRILLHMDRGQDHIHKDVDQKITTLFTKFEQRKTAFSLSMTIYDDNIADIPSLLLKFGGFSYFDGILATLVRDAGQTLNKKTALTINVNLISVYHSIRQNLMIEPTTYLPTSLSTQSISWLLYFYYVNAASGKTFMISSKLNGLFRKTYRAMTGHYVFGLKMNSVLKSVVFIITAIIELMIDPARFKEFVSLVKRSSLLTMIRFHYIVIQDGPRFNAEKNCLEFCYHCPDATIRNGMITPVCLADHINPLGGEKEKSETIEEACLTVYRHLEEI